MHLAHANGDGKMQHLGGNVQHSVQQCLHFHLQCTATAAIANKDNIFALLKGIAKVRLFRQFIQHIANGIAHAAFFTALPWGVALLIIHLQHRNLKRRILRPTKALRLHAIVNRKGGFFDEVLQ